MNKITALLLTVSLIVLTNAASALPRFALMTGRTCASCHFNYSGGQLRNGDGADYAQEDLSLTALRSTQVEYSSEINKNIFLGGEMRTQFLSMSDDNRSGKTFQMMQTAIYTGVTLSEQIKFYAKADIVNSDFEAFATVGIIPKNLFLRVGAFLPLYGIRYDDHTLYTRGGNTTVFGLGKAGLIFPYNYKDAGIELAFMHQNILNAQIAILNGGRVYPRFDSSFALCGRVELTPSVDNIHFSIGGSFYNHAVPFSEAQGGARTMFGGFFGVGYDRFTLMGEFDAAKNLPRYPKDAKSQAYFAELSVRIIDGLDLIGRYEGFDPNTEVDNDKLTRMVFGFEFFPWSFFEFRPQFRFNTEERMTTTGTQTTTEKIKSNQYVAQFHFWF